jgi:hypothetical protein
MRGTLVLLALLALVPRVGWGQGSPVGPEFRVNTYTTGYQRFGSVGADPSGNFVVVWHSQQDGSFAGVFGQRYASSGAPVGVEFRINSYTTEIQVTPMAAFDSSGSFVVVWASYTQDGSSHGVFGQRYNSVGAPQGPEFRVNTFTPNPQRFPSLAPQPAGSFVVVWQSYAQDGSDYGVFAQRYAGSGAPIGPEFRVNTYATGRQLGASVAAALSGSFVVVWGSDPQDGSLYGVFGQRFDNAGTPVGPEFRVNTYTPGFQYRPAVAADATGSFVVVWHSLGQDGSYHGVFGQRFSSSGTPLGSEFRVNTFTTGIQIGPSVAADASGNFVVSWASFAQDGSSAGLFGQRYDSTGTPQGPEFRVNTYTTDDQYGVRSIATDSLGNFVVVWASETQDGSSHGVFGQRFNMIVPVELIRFGVE